MSQIFNYTWFILCLTGQKLSPLIRRHFLRWNLFINYWEHLTLRKTWFHLVFTCRYRSHWRLGLLEHLLVFWLAWTLFLIQFFFAHGWQGWHWGPVGHRNSLRSSGPKSVLEFTRWCGLRFLDLIRRWLLSLISFELILKLHFRANLWEESWRLLRQFSPFLHLCHRLWLSFSSLPLYSSGLLILSDQSQSFYPSTIFSVESPLPRRSYFWVRNHCPYFSKTP